MPPEVDTSRALSATTFREFDDAATAPLHKFEGAEDDYRRCSSAPYITRIRKGAPVMLRSFTRPTLHLYVRGTRTMVVSCMGCHCDPPSRQSHRRRSTRVSSFVTALTEPLQRQFDIARRQNVRVMEPNVLKDGAVDADTWCPTLNARRGTGWKYVDWLAIAGEHYRAGRASKARRFLVANHGANGHHGVRRRIHISWSAEVR